MADQRGVSCVMSTGCSKISEMFNALFWCINGKGNDGPSVTSSRAVGLNFSRLLAAASEAAAFSSVYSHPRRCSSSCCCCCMAGVHGDANPSPSSTEKGNPRKVSNPLEIGKYSGCWPRCLASGRARARAHVRVRVRAHVRAFVCQYPRTSIVYRGCLWTT